MESWLKFLTEYKDPLELLCGSGLVIALLTALWRISVWLLREWRIRQFRGTPFPFRIFQPNSTLVSAILDSAHEPLPPSTIPYQARVSGYDTQTELERFLNEHHWLLILGETGTGKTREAAELAQRFNHKGWTVLYLTQTDLVNEPATLHPELRDRQLLIFLDDLNRKLWRGRSEHLNRPGDSLQQFQMALQERLLRWLKKYQAFCGANEIRVIATARNETERERADEPSEWEKLEWETYRQFWNRFARYPLPRADETAQTNVLRAAIEQTGVATDLDDAGLRHVARKNFGSLRNLIVNVTNAKLENRSFTAGKFLPTPNETWQARYDKNTERFPAARYVYDAVDLLRTTRIDLFDFTVQPAARLIAGGNLLRRARRWWHIRRAARYLIRAEHILEPSDGQIEAKPTRVDPTPYLPALTRLVLESTKQHPRAMLGSLFGLGWTLYDAGQFELAVPLMRAAIRLDPNDAKAHDVLGLLLGDMGRPADAEAAYREAIRLDPNLAATHFILGTLLAKNPERATEAEAEYRAAIRLDPNLAQAHNNLGTLLAKNPERATEAEAEYREAIRLDPNLAQAHNNLGTLLAQNPARATEAEAEFHAAIRLDPNDAAAHNNLGALLDEKLNRPDEAEAEYRAAIRLDPNDAAAHYNLGVLLAKNPARTTDAEAEAEYRAALRLDPNYAQAHSNLGTLLAQNPARATEAEAEFHAAIRLDPNDAAAHNNLGALLDEKLNRPDEAEAEYRAAIRLDPNLAAAHNNLGNLLHEKLNRPADAEAEYRAAIELEPNNPRRYFGLTLLLRQTEREVEAIPLLEKMLQLDAQDADPPLALASVHKKLGHLEESATFAAQARALMKPEDWYNLACLESVCGNVDAAIEHLRRAAQAEDFDRAYAKGDPDWEWIRDDPRFKEIVGE